MISTDQAMAIVNLPKRQQGPKIDEAINSLLQNGRTAQDAFAELGALINMTPQAIAAGFYRRKRMAGEGRVVRVSSDDGTPPKAEAKRTAKSNGRWDAFEALINEMVEERVQARLAEVRKALG